MDLPKITIVTTSYNRCEYLEETICSVMDQDYQNLEYIIIDGMSTDGSIDIIRKHENKLHYWVSEQDDGQYYAINKGFSHGKGDIMGWINSDDLIFPGALKSIGNIFACNPEVEWLTGVATTINSDGNLIKAFPQYKYKRESFLLGSIRGVQQESTFWSRSLWEKAGGRINTSYKYAADYELWARFFQYADLTHVHTLLGKFRRHRNQITVFKRSDYYNEVMKIRKVYKRKLSVMDKILGCFYLLQEIVAKRLASSSDIVYELDAKKFIAR